MGCLVGSVSPVGPSCKPWERFALIIESQTQIVHDKSEDQLVRALNMIQRRACLRSDGSIEEDAQRAIEQTRERCR